MKRPFRKWWLAGLAAVILLAQMLNPVEVLNAEAAETPAHHEAASVPVTGKKAPAPSEPKGVFEKPLTIKGTDIQVQFGGFVKVDFMYDLDPIGNADQFKVNSIPVDGDPDAELGGSTNISAKQTRLDVDVRSNTPAGLMRAYVEGDFFGSSNAFRLRHAYGEWNGLLGGQTWSTFQDISARPFTLDYEGPDTEIFVRQPQIRYTGTPSDQFEWAVAVEDPDSQISAPAGVSGSGRSEWPDIPAYLRFNQGWGHIQLAGILRQLRYVSDGGAIDDSTIGYGLNLSGKLKVAKSDALMGHIGFGSGVGRYIEAFGGTNSDAVLTPSGEVEALDAWAMVLGYTHHWNDKLNSTISGGFAELDNHDSQPDDAIKSAQSGHLNLVYSPFRLLSLGGEVMYGKRENKNGADGDAVRLQFSIKYNFR
jgi:hypothetical protein